MCKPKMPLVIICLSLFSLISDVQETQAASSPLITKNTEVTFAAADQQMFLVPNSEESIDLPVSGKDTIPFTILGSVVTLGLGLLSLRKNTIEQLTQEAIALSAPNVANKSTKTSRQEIKTVSVR
ncbi:MAG: hypothetical protein F6K36_27110 [Symploca sp. SIO3C6]|nr:hypothetical protein [Symploca sp. SIO3C6]